MPHHLAYLVALSVLGWSDRPSNTFPLTTAPRDKNQSDSSLVNNFHTRFEPPAITKLWFSTISHFYPDPWEKKIPSWWTFFKWVETWKPPTSDGWSSNYMSWTSPKSKSPLSMAKVLIWQHWSGVIKFPIFGGIKQYKCCWLFRVISL